MTDDNIARLREQYPDDPHEVIKRISIAGLRELREMKSTQEILRWELVDDSDLSKVFLKYMNKQLKSIQESFSSQISVVNIQATGAIISSAIVYLALLSKNRRYIYDIDLHSDQGWEDIENGFNFLLDALNEKIIREEKRDMLVFQEEAGDNGNGLR